MTSSDMSRTATPERKALSIMFAIWATYIIGMFVMDFPTYPPVPFSELTDAQQFYSMAWIPTLIGSMLLAWALTEWWSNDEHY